MGGHERAAQQVDVATRRHDLHRRSVAQIQSDRATLFPSRPPILDRMGASGDEVLSGFVEEPGLDDQDIVHPTSSHDAAQPGRRSISNPGGSDPASERPGSEGGGSASPDRGNEEHPRQAQDEHRGRGSPRHRSALRSTAGGSPVPRTASAPTRDAAGK
jgi:hypothetical protein